MVKKICLVSFIGLFMAGFFFHQSFQTFLVTTLLQKYFHKEFGQPLIYTEVLREGNRLVYIKPHLEDETIFNSEKLILTYEWNLLARKIDLSIELEKPHFHFAQEKIKIEGFNQSNSFFKPRGKWIKIHPTIVIKEGVLTWLSVDHSHHSLHFDFAFDGHWGGNLTAQWENGEKETNLIKMAAMSENKEVHIDLSCVNLNCPPLMDLLQQLFPPLTSFQLPSGRLNGELKGIFPEKDKPYLVGNLLIDDFSFAHLHHGLSGHLEQAKLEFIKDSNTEGQSLTSFGHFEILKPASVEYDDWKVDLKGNVNGLLHLDLENKSSQKLVVKDFQADDCQLKRLSSNSVCSFNKIKGQGTIDLADENRLSSLNAELLLENGTFLLDSLNPKFILTDIQTHLHIHKGEIPHSQVTLQLAGLKGHMDIEWIGGKELISLKLSGQVDELANFLPGRLKHGLHQIFKGDSIGVLANVKKHSGQLGLTGTAYIQNNKSEEFDLVHFGFDIQQSPLFSLPKGWFHARCLPLEKYLSPFLFRQGVLEMSGTGEFKGSLENDLLTIKYNVEDLKLENDNLLIIAENLELSNPGEFRAFHTIDLKTLSHEGELPLESVSYLDKNSGLIFEDISGNMLFHQMTLSIEAMEAFSNDVYFSGSLDLDYSDPAPGVFNLAIHSPYITGKVSQVKQLLAHLHETSLLSQLFLEGDLSGRQKGLEVEFAFVPNDYTLKADVQGSVNNGSLLFESADMALKGLYMDLDYHHDNQLLKFSEIQGALLVGKPSCVEEYIFAGDHISFEGLIQQDLDLDVSIKDQNDELMRIVAQTTQSNSGLRNVILDNALTHFSHIYPTAFTCCFKESEIQSFNFESTFELSPFLNDLKRFKKTGLFCFSHVLLSKITHLEPVEGKMDLKLAYQPADDVLEYLLVSDQVKVHSQMEHRCLLKGRKRGKNWYVDQLQWDKMSIFSELYQAESHWKVNSLGFNDGESILLGLQGNLNLEENCFTGKFNLCEVNGESYPLKEIEITLDDNLLNMRTNTHYRRIPFEVIATTNWPDFNEGALSFIDPLVKTTDGVHPLVIAWTKDENKRLTLQSIQGQFCGLWADLYAKKTAPNDTDYSALEGKVDIDFNSLCPILDDGLAETIRKLEVGAFYTMDGLYWINPTSHQNFLETLFFEGKLTSQDAILKGYQLSKLEAQVNYTPGRLEFINFAIDDPSGTLRSDSMIAVLDKKTDDWSFHIPKMGIKKFKPTLLRQPRHKMSGSSRFKTLVIKKIEIENFYGQLNDSKTWIAKGGLHFQNTTRKNLAHPLLAIPGEIILRLGLDPSVLNPVTGSVYFNLKEDRFYLTKMKDVFSEGRGSKFYLADNKDSSWMDLDGNLSVQIRMKQYNIIFKIAELFTVSIQGNIKKPTYTLQKQGKIR